MLSRSLRQEQIDRRDCLLDDEDIGKAKEHRVQNGQSVDPVAEEAHWKRRGDSVSPAPVYKE